MLHPPPCSSPTRPDRSGTAPTGPGAAAVAPPGLVEIRSLPGQRPGPAGLFLPLPLALVAQGLRRWRALGSAAAPPQVIVHSSEMIIFSKTRRRPDSRPRGGSRGPVPGRKSRFAGVAVVEVAVEGWRIHAAGFRPSPRGALQAEGAAQEESWAVEGMWATWEVGVCLHLAFPWVHPSLGSGSSIPSLPHWQWGTSSADG